MIVEGHFTESEIRSMVDFGATVSAGAHGSVNVKFATSHHYQRWKSAQKDSAPQRWHLSFLFPASHPSER